MRACNKQRSKIPLGTKGRTSIPVSYTHRDVYKRQELIVPELAKRNGVTEQLKADKQMEWVRQMNACKAQAEEIVRFELIYD